MTVLTTTTRFYVPFTEINQQVVDSAPADAIWVDVSAHKDAYWEALRDIWDRGETFAIIEHDVICPPGIAELFDACECWWATHSYLQICHEECREAWANQLGCTRFRAELIAACPDALSSIPEGRRNWHNLCDEIAGNKIGGVDQPTLRPGSLRAANFSHHWHEPHVSHHPWFVSR